MSDDPVTAAELEAALRQLHRMELSTRAGLERVEALVTAKLADDAGATAVALTTDLAVTGKVAQLGGGMMSEVALS